MKLKKWGSLLTALAMIGSMATYVPATVSAAETEETETDTVYSGVLEYHSDIAFTLDMNDKEAQEDGTAASGTPMLTFSSTKTDKTYAVPYDVLSDVAYYFETSVAGTAFEKVGDFSNVEFAFKDAPTITLTKVEEADTLEGIDEITEADCRTIVLNADGEDVTATWVNADNITHEYQPNTTYHNHICANCSDVNNTFDAHEFDKKDGATISTTKNTHTCACGKVDTDYLVYNEDGTLDTEADSVEYYKAIHGFTADPVDHYCEDCKAYDVVAHAVDGALTITPHATSPAKYHTYVCGEDCGYEKAKEAHTITVVQPDAPKAEYVWPTTVVNGKPINQYEHFCSLCGYVSKNSSTGLYNGGHSYDYNWSWDAEANDGAGDWKLVAASAVGKGLVCKCGMVKESHTTHTMIAENDHHYCACGEMKSGTEAHAYLYIYNGVGESIVDGKAGYILASSVGETGVVCACGKVDPEASHIHDSVGEEAYVDKTAMKHYCVCGDVIADANGKVIHEYVTPANEKHTCSCGASSEAYHYYNSDDATALVGEASVTYYIVVKNEAGKKSLAEMVGTDSDWTMSINGDEVESADYTAYNPDSEEEDKWEEIEFDAAKGVICACGKIDPSHDCDFETSYMTANDVHYCSCGAASEEHEYVSGVCKTCGAHEEHECVINTAITDNCVCKTCGNDMHDLIAKGTSHKCVRCNKDVEEHVYDVDTTNHKHICTICNYVYDGEGENPHRYDAEGVGRCVCTLCGDANRHTFVAGDNTETDEKEVHYCTRCATSKDAHDYDSITGLCTIPNATGTCNAASEDHVCQFFSNDVTTNDETTHHACACGKEVKHEFKIAPVGTHTCVSSQTFTLAQIKASAMYAEAVAAYNPETEPPAGLDPESTDEDVLNWFATGYANKAVDEKKLTVTVTCGHAEDHDYDEKTDTFCTVCGAVNFATTSNTAFTTYNANVSAFETAKANFTASNIVSLTKAQLEVDVYDAEYVFAKACGENNTATNSVASAPADVQAAIAAYFNANIKTASTTTEQTAFNKLLTTYNNLYTAALKDLASSIITVIPAADCDAMIDDEATEKLYTSTGSIEIAEDDERDTYVYNAQAKDTVTLSVIPESGFIFEGWYDKDPSDATAKKLSSDQSYTFKAPEKEGTYYVKLVKNTDTVSINFAGFAVTGTGTATGEFTVMGSQNFAIGEIVTIHDEEATAYVDNNNTVYNLDSNDEFEFTVVDSITSFSRILTDAPEVTGKKANTLMFFNSNDADTAKMLNSSIAYVDASAKNIDLTNYAPAKYVAPYGQTFKGWAICNPNADLTTNDIVRIQNFAITAGQDNTYKFAPVCTYTTGYQLTIEGGQFVGLTDDQKANGFTYNDKVRIYAEEMDTKTGKYFSGWYVNDVLYSTDRATYYTVKGNDSIVAKFNNETPAEEISYVTLSANTSYDSGVRLVNLQSKWNLLEDEYASVLDSGYVFSFTGATQAELTVDNVDGTDVRKKSTGITGLTNAMNYPMKLTSDATKNATVTAVAYLTVRNANGVVETIYSQNMVTATPAN